MNRIRSEATSPQHAEEARTLYALKRYPEALTACHRAIANDPEEPSNYATLTQIHLQLKQPQEALEAGRKVVTLAPEWPFGYYLMSFCLHGCLDFDGELRAAEHAASLDPEDPIILDRLARAQLQSGLLKRAKTTATQLTRVSPEDADTFSLLSDICFQLNDFTNAENHLLAALQLAPEDHVLHNDLGRIHLARKAWRQAIDAFYNAAKLNPVEQSYQQNLNYAISSWLGKQAMRGKKSRSLETLPPAIRAFYQHKLDSRTAFERLGLFGPLLVALILLIALTAFFDILR
jgi:tetratricopeptide (TPR) repeat protein